MKIISRKDAKDQGLKRYYAGKPCRQGHISERYVLRGECAECARMRNLRTRGRTDLRAYRSRKIHQDYITRSEAIAAELLRYFTGNPCANQHVCERYTSTGRCCECRANIQGTEEYRLAKQKLNAQYRQTHAYKSKKRESDRKQRSTPEYRERMKLYFRARRAKLKLSNNQSNTTC